MKFSTIASALALAAPIAAAPAKRDGIAPADLLVLQFALTLEHLENAFYSRFLRRLGAVKDFGAIGLPPSYQYKLRYIASDEKSHVKLLSDAITASGNTPVQECDYTFQDQELSAKDFITLSTVLEGVGTSAYLGAAGIIVDKGYLTVAGSILVTESLHTSFQRDTSGLIPFATPYGTPLDPNSVFTLAASFIKKCPSKADSTKVLSAAGFTANPALTSTATGPVANSATVSFTTADDATAGKFLTFISGLGAYSAPATASGKTYTATIPSADVAGQTYVLLTETAAADNKPANIGKIVAGPSIIEVTPAEPCFLSKTGCGVA